MATQRICNNCGEQTPQNNPTCQTCGHKPPTTRGPRNPIYYTAQWRTTRTHILNRDNHQCVNCGSTHNLHIDHIHQLHHGGDPYNPNNLRTLCATCNLTRPRKNP